MTPGAPARVRIDDMQDCDLQEVATFLFREGQGREPTPEEAGTAIGQLAHLLRGNPVKPPGVPFGWVIRPGDQDRIVGAMCCIPWRLAGPGGDHVSLMSAKFFVEQPFRGAGFAIFKRYLKLGRQFPLHCTTAGAQSAPLWQQFGAYPIPRHDSEMIGFADRSRLVEEGAFRVLKNRPLAASAQLAGRLLPRGLRRLRAAEPGAELIPVQSPADLHSLAPEPANVLTTRRDQAYLQWRYFTRRGPELHILRRDGESDLAIAVEQHRRGFAGQIRALSVQDIFGRATDARDSVAVAAALARRYHGAFDMLVMRSMTDAQQGALAKAGLVRRAFAAPIAWCIDNGELLPTRDWHLVPADAE